MIKLTRLNNAALIINAELIEFVEESPDTLVTLTTGQKIMVKESVDEVVERVIEYRRSIVSRPLSDS